MEKSILSIALLFSALMGMAQAEQREFEMTEGDTTYVMKQYIFCLYLEGEERSQSEEALKEIQAGHMAHIASLEASHGLQLAGPFGDDGHWRGLLLFDLAEVREAEAAMAADPAVKAGRLKFECHPWWGAKGTSLK